MDESSRVPQRSRPRPYDLRRKVLLKNFLREQMTHIPLPPPRMPMEDDSIADDEVSSTVGNEENIEQSSNIQEKPSNKQENAPPVSVPEPMASTSTSHFISTFTENSPDSSTSQQPEIEVDKNSQPTFTRLSNLLRGKINSVRNRRKGIMKAKLKMKAKSPAQQSILRVSNNAGQSTKSKSKSFFTMFKTRHGKRNLKSPTRISSPVSKSSTSNQSVQTDASFTQDEFNNMEQSNRSLREENRLLSESLSSFMSDFDLKLSPLKIPYGTDSYITSSGSSEPPSVSQQTFPNVAKRLDYNDNASKNRVQRSKSMQDRLDIQFPNRSRLRTRSMNYGLNKRFYDSSSLPQSNPYPDRRNYNSVTSHPSINSRRARVRRYSFPSLNSYTDRMRSNSAFIARKARERREFELISNFDRVTSNASFIDHRERQNSFSSFNSNPNSISMPEPISRLLPHRASVLKNLPINNSSRAIVRRSSMPERTRISTPLSNFSMLPNQSSVLKNLPINNSNRGIVRRCSMPASTSRQLPRPILPQKSTTVNGNKRRSVYDNSYDYNAANRNVPNRQRSHSNGDYGRSVPFQNLPREAFY